MDDPTTASFTRTFVCTNCGAVIKYQPGPGHLYCESCDAKNEIPKIETNDKEMDFREFLAQQSETADTLIESYIKCNGCGSSTTVDPQVTTMLCSYCSTPLAIEKAHNEKVIAPKSILPFKLDRKTARNKFNKWLKNLILAPGSLKKAVLDVDHFKGVYIPYWTFDTDTFSKYVGKRGVNYTATESYTTTVHGESVTKERRVVLTDWYPAHGEVRKFFNDILVPATGSLPQEYITALEPWDLENLVLFDKSYLTGYTAEKYQIKLAEGFEIAKVIADAGIRSLACKDIGGDDQQITSLDSEFNSITFKHVLLPVYVSAYKYKGKLYQFIINARTGEVHGDRPWNWIKIVVAALVILVIIGSLLVFEYMHK